MKPKTIYLALAAFCLILTSVYLVNPLGTATLDPRARIAGVMPMRQSSDSMAPTLWTGDFLFVSAWAYARSDPVPGDIAVFNYPKDRSSNWSKRVIAVGGSSVEIVDGVTRVDGKIFPEPWTDGQPYRQDFSLNMEAVKVPEGQYFVMGDNRDNSLDSRSWGFVPRDHFSDASTSDPRFSWRTISCTLVARELESRHAYALSDLRKDSAQRHHAGVQSSGLGLQ